MTELEKLNQKFIQALNRSYEVAIATEIEPEKIWVWIFSIFCQTLEKYLLFPQGSLSLEDLTIRYVVKLREEGEYRNIVNLQEVFFYTLHYYLFDLLSMSKGIEMFSEELYLSVKRQLVHREQQ